MLRLMATCAVLLGAAALAADPQLSSDDQLLQALAGPDWHQRREAIHQITQLGADADARVSDLLKRNLDHEQRKNVELALQLIRDNRLFGASPITLRVKQASAAEVMSAVAAQCGGPLPSSPSDLLKQGKWPKLTLDYDRKPFWDVMKDLASRLEIDYLSSDPEELRLTKAGGRRGGIVATSGAFLFTANAIGGFRRGLSLEFAVYAEPKVLVLRTIDLRIERAVDDQGNVLTPQSGRGFGRRGFNGGPFGRRVRNGPRLVSAQFQRPPGDRIAELRGHVKLSVQNSATQWEVSDVLEMSPVTRTIDAIPVTLDSVKSISGDTYQLQLSIPYDWNHTGPQQEEVIELMRRGLTLRDAAGRKLLMDVADARPQSTSTEIDVNFSRVSGGVKTGPPVKLIWTVPDQVRELLVPFQFKDILLDDLYN